MMAPPIPPRSLRLLPEEVAARNFWEMAREAVAGDVSRLSLRDFWESFNDACAALPSPGNPAVRGILACRVVEAADNDTLRALSGDARIGILAELDAALHGWKLKERPVVRLLTTAPFSPEYAAWLTPRVSKAADLLAKGVDLAFQRRNWSCMKGEDKLAFARRTAELYAQAFGINPPPTVEPFAEGPSPDGRILSGQYDARRNVIRLNTAAASSWSDSDSLFYAAIHECQHAVQYHLMDGRLDAPELHERTLLRWNDRFYVTWKDSTLGNAAEYQAQIMERDANFVADTIVKTTIYCEMMRSGVKPGNTPLSAQRRKTCPHR